MKACFISDIHGISKNLNHIKEIIDKNKIELLVVLGDLYYPGPNYEGKEKINSKEVKDFLMSYQDKIIGMKGNCDSSVDIKASDFPISDGISLIETNPKKIFITHGNEYNKDFHHKIPNNSVLVYGHEHIPYIKKDQDKIFINVGSISIPKEGYLPSYGILDNNTFTIFDCKDKKIDSITI